MYISINNRYHRHTAATIQISTNEFNVITLCGGVSTYYMSMLKPMSMFADFWRRQRETGIFITQIISQIYMCTSYTVGAVSQWNNCLENCWTEWGITERVSNISNMMKIETVLIRRESALVMGWPTNRFSRLSWRYQEKNSWIFWGSGSSKILIFMESPRTTCPKRCQCLLYLLRIAKHVSFNPSPLLRNGEIVLYAY